MRAVIYCRVSSTEQTKNLSLPTQEKACRQYCAHEGYDVDQVFVDAGESAKTTDRPAFNDLLRHCRAKKGSIHAVVVYSLTRFSRNSTDHHTIASLLRGFGITLRSVTEPIDESPSGRLMEGILAAMAQFDNEARTERVLAGMKAAIDRGRWQWRVPLGYLRGNPRAGGTSLVHDPAKAPLVRQLFEACADGTTGRALVELAVAIGLTQPNAKPLHRSQVYGIVRNPIYAGQLRATTFGAGGAGDWTGIVSEELFARVQRRLAQPSRAAAARARHVDHPDFPLRRFVTCGICSKPLTAAWTKGHGGRYGYYQCVRGCSRIRKGKLEDAFVRLMDGLRPKPERWKVLRRLVLDTYRDERKGTRDRLEISRRRVGELERKLALVDDAYLFRQAIDDATYISQRDALREQVALARLELTEADTEAVDVEGLLAFAQHALSHASAFWTGAGSSPVRLQVQWAFFPQGLTWKKGTFSTVSNLPNALNFFEMRPSKGDTVLLGGRTAANFKPREFIQWIQRLRETLPAAA